MQTALRFSFRSACAADLAALLELESGFPGDRLSARQLRHHLRNPRARLRVLLHDGAVRGYALVLLHPAGRVARLYSIAVHAGLRGQGAGGALLRDAEAQARAAGAACLRLEVRCDNRAAIALYRDAGYEAIGTRSGYYADGASALRFERSLGPARPPV